MGGHKARVYYDLEGMPHTWIQLSSPDGTTETRGFGPTVYSPVWKGKVKDDSDHEWSLYREYDISEKEYSEMKGVIDNWGRSELTYVFGRRDCRDLVHDAMAKRGGYDGAVEYGFNSRSRIAFTPEGCFSIFKELGRDFDVSKDISAKIRSQGGSCSLLDEAGVQEAFESGYWPGPYGPGDDSWHSSPGI